MKIEDLSNARVQPLVIFSIGLSGISITLHHTGWGHPKADFSAAPGNPEGLLEKQPTNLVTGADKMGNEGVFGGDGGN